MRIRAYGLTESDFPDAWEMKEIPRGYFWDRDGDLISGMASLAAFDTVTGEAIACEYVPSRKLGCEGDVLLTRLKLTKLKLPLSFGWIDEEKTLRIA